MIIIRLRWNQPANTTNRCRRNDMRWTGRAADFSSSGTNNNNQNWKPNNYMASKSQPYYSKNRYDNHKNNEWYNKEVKNNSGVRGVPDKYNIINYYYHYIFITATSICIQSIPLCWLFIILIKFMIIRIIRIVILQIIIDV